MSEKIQNIIGVAILIAIILYAGIYRGCFANPSIPQECWCDYGYLGFRCDCDAACEIHDAACEADQEGYR